MKLGGYVNPNARFIIMRDQDQSDCRSLKADLATHCPDSHRLRTTIRIACRELEAFYLGDLQAVETGLGIKGLAAKQGQAKYRVPDQLRSPSGELEKLTGGVYQKVAGSRAIAPHLNLHTPLSRSFHHLLDAVRRAAGNLHQAASQ